MSNKNLHDRKFIFLDIDGVLNHQGTFLNRKKVLRSLTKEEQAALKRVDIAPHEIDKTALKRLGLIVKATDADIVVSSTWRKMYSLDEFRYIFDALGFPYSDKIIDCTPVIDSPWSLRGNEIRAWLETYRRENNMLWDEKIRYVILDDDSDMLLWQKDHFVQTSFKEGLTPEHAIRATNILHGEIEG